MDLKSYIAETERVYRYRVKTVAVLDDYAMDRLERTIMKYDPVDISRPRKLMMQKAPLDFTTVDAAEIYVTDLTLALPASSYVLQKELGKVLGLPETHIIVRGYNDPTEIENERLVAGAELNAEAIEKGMKPEALLNDSEYSEAQQTGELYGDAYNAKFLDYLKGVQKEREAESKVDAPNALFKWLDMPQNDVADDAGGFNANVEPAKGGENDGGEQTPSNQGNLTDRKRNYKRLYGKNGTRTVLSRDVDTTKDPK